jgi:hypothetical protein
VRLFGPLIILAPLAALLRVTVVPLWEATVGRRVWITARSANPPTTMLWRATGRTTARAAVEEIAAALARGEERPVPLSARWVGYTEGAIRLPPKANLG